MHKEGNKLCITYPLIYVRVISALVLAHSGFNSYAPELVPIFQITNSFQISYL